MIRSWSRRLGWFGFVVATTPLIANDYTLSDCTWAEGFPNLPEVSLRCQGTDDPIYVRQFQFGLANCTATYRDGRRVRGTVTVYCGTDARGNFPTTAQQCNDAADPSLNIEAIRDAKAFETKPRFTNNATNNEITGISTCSVLKGPGTIRTVSQCRTRDEQVRSAGICTFIASCSVTLTDRRTQTRTLGISCAASDTGTCPRTPEDCFSGSRPSINVQDLLLAARDSEKSSTRTDVMIVGASRHRK